MTNHVRKLDNRHSSFELLDDKGVAKIVYLGSSDPGNAEVAIDGGANIADQEGVTSLRNKEGGIFGFGTTSDIFFNGSFGGRV